MNGSELATFVPASVEFRWTAGIAEARARRRHAGCRAAFRATLAAATAAVFAAAGCGTGGKDGGGNPGPPKAGAQAGGTAARKNDAGYGSLALSARKYPVRTEAVSARPLKYEIETTGALEAYDVYRIDAQVPGAVEGASFREGDEAGPGTVLCRVSPETYRLAVGKAEDARRMAEAELADTIRRTANEIERAKIRLAEAEGDLERRLPAAAAGALTEQELASYRNKRDLARVELKDAEQAAATLVEVKKAALREKETLLALAKEDLRKSAVVPPVAGVIEQKLVSNGAVVSPGTPVALLVDRRLKLKFVLSERESARVREGTEVAFSVQAYPNRRFAAKVYRIGDLADPKTRQVTCWASVEQSEGARLRAGFFASVRIVAEEKKNAVVVPLTAVLPTERGFVAFVVSEGRAFRRPVTLGLHAADDSVEVLDGLKEGEVIVREGGNALRDGVQVIEAGGPPRGGAEAGRPKEGWGGK